MFLRVRCLAIVLLVLSLRFCVALLLHDSSGIPVASGRSANVLEAGLGVGEEFPVLFAHPSTVVTGGSVPLSAIVLQQDRAAQQASKLEVCERVPVSLGFVL